MGLHSQHSDASDPGDLLESQIRESFGRVTYSHKTHEKCADSLLTSLTWIKVFQIALPAISTGGFISLLFGSGMIGTWIGAASSAILLALNLYTKDTDLADLARKHRQTASDIWLIREKHLSLITDLAMGDHSLGAIREQRDSLVAELHGIYSSSPDTTSRAYRKAQRALKWDEEMTFSDEEIDAFLPNTLRRSNRG